MKTLKTFSAAALMFAVFSAALLAAPVAYPFRVVDNSGTLVAGATVQIGATALTSGSATSVPSAAGEKVLSTNAAPGSTVSVTLLDYGTGDYAIVSDPATNGELYLPLTVSKTGSTITAGNALIALVASIDPSNISIGTTNTGTLITGQATISGKTNLIATNAADSPAAVTAQAQATSNGAGIASLTSLATTGAGVKLASTEYANIAAMTSTYGFDGPPAGTILTLTITRNGASQPVLTWTADPAATSYKVYRSTDGANYTVIATPAVGTLTYTDTARPAGATVYYHITSAH